MTLRSKVTFSFVLVVALTLAGSGWYFLHHFEQSFRRSMYESLNNIASARGKSIGDYLRLQLVAANHIGTMVSHAARKAENFAELESVLGQLSKDFPVFENGFFILSPEGKLLVDYPPHPEKRGKDFSFRPYFQRTMRAQTGIVGQPYRSSRTGEAVLTFTAYLVDVAGKPLGVLGCSAQLLAEGDLGLLRKQKIGNTGYSYVFDSSRLMILHPKDERVLTRDVPVGANKMFDAALEGFRGATETVNSKGVPMLVAFQQVPNSDWIIGCQQPADEAFASLATTKKQILLFIGIGCVVAAVAGLLLVLHNLRDLGQLEAITADLAVPQPGEKNAAEIIRSESSKLDGLVAHQEFGPLASTIRSLYARLGQSLDRTQQMTEELDKAYQQLKETQTQILQQEKMASIGQLAAGVAHEINNPMGFISSNLGSLGKYLARLSEYQQQLEEWLQQAGSEEIVQAQQALRRRQKIDYLLEDIPELIEESKSGTERVREIVQNLKGFSRLDQAEFCPVDLNDCLEKTISIAWNELKYKATLERNYGELPLLPCFPQQLNQVFLNLLVNAAQALTAKGTIRVRTWADEKNVYVAIQDDGCGIPAEIRDRIFEPFFTTKEVGKGTGLGMSISYDIIKKHQGEIELESEEGVGTTFTVILPLMQEGAIDG